MYWFSVFFLSSLFCRFIILLFSFLKPLYRPKKVVKAVDGPVASRFVLDLWGWWWSWVIDESEEGDIFMYQWQALWGWTRTTSITTTLGKSISLVECKNSRVWQCWACVGKCKEALEIVADKDGGKKIGAGTAAAKWNVKEAEMCQKNDGVPTK